MPVGPYQALKKSSAVKTPPVTGSIVRMDANVVDSSGKVIPQSQVMLHHLVFFNDGRPGARRRDGACPTHDVGERFYGTSEELRALTMPAGYGYRIDRREKWGTAWMLMNHTHQDRRAWIRYRVTVDTSRQLKPVKPYWVSIVPCVSDPQFSVPGGGPGQSTSTRWVSWKVPFTGRIVAVGGHLHGGSRDLRLTQPRCAGRTLVVSHPTYGMPDNPVYQVFPLLHEPDPLNITWWQSATGVPVVKGEKLRLASDYDGQWPHMRVMGIDHVYVTPDAHASRACTPLPADAQEPGPDWVGRPTPPHVELTLAAMGRDGYARPIDAPPGRVVSFNGAGSVRELGFGFHPSNISIPLGASVRWSFGDSTQHDVTLNNGPRGFAGPWSKKGRTWRYRFTVPGTYKLYCSLHPVYMSQVVRVRGG